MSLVVNDAESVKACYRTAVHLLDGRGLDFLINNAGKSISPHRDGPLFISHTDDGIGSVRPAIEIDISEAKEVFGSNIIGVMDMTQTFFPELLLARGTIVNVGSVAGHMPLPFHAVYSATKAALYAYSDCMRVELAPFGIKVVYIQTGNVSTNLVRSRTALNEDSIFMPIEEEFLKRQDVAATTGMEPLEFAKLGVQRLLAGPSNVIWLGESALLCRVINTLENCLPFNFWPFLFSQEYHLGKLKK